MLRTRQGRRLPVLILLLVLLGASLVQLTGVRPAAAASTVVVNRLQGADRYATAAATAAAAFPHGTGTVVVASGRGFADALTGAFLAGQQPGGAPLLLVAPSLPLPPATTAALTKLGARRLMVVGGPAAVGSDVVSALGALRSGPGGLPPSVERLAGPTRFDTMALVDTTPGATIGQVAGAPTAILATGMSFADALGAAPLAYARHFPLILTDGRSATPPAQVSAVLRADHITHLVVVGGPAAVAPAQETQLHSLGVSLDLRATQGLNRSDTSVQLGALEITAFGFSASRFDLARGDEFADALAAGPLGGVSVAPTLVTASPANAGSVPNFIRAHATSPLTGYALGGPGALSPGLLTALTAVVAPTSPAPKPTSTTTTTTTPKPTTTSTSTTTTTTTSTTTTTVVPPASDPFRAGATGYDVSWPQCSTSLPPSAEVAVVGVDNGRPLTTNPCLASEATWAGTGASGYLTLASPPNGWSGGGCSAGDASCLAYAYGQASVSSATKAARAAGFSPPVWWVAVVTGENWSNTTALNDRVVQGALDAVATQGTTAGVYSSPSQWQSVAGSWTTAVPAWLAGDAADPAAACGQAGFSSAGAWLVQVPGSSWDVDGACPLGAGTILPGSAPTAGGSNPYAAGAAGYDISWPQCPVGYPTRGAVSIIGANNGRPFSTNACLASEAAWAGPGPSVYLNLASPAGPSGAMTGPAGACSASDLSCQAYNYGANSVAYSRQALAGAGVVPRFFWLDVETGNAWSSSPADNVQVVKGALAALAGAGLGRGIYSTTYQWGVITGGWNPAVPQWIPSGVASAASASGYCGRSYFSSGPTYLVQFGAGSYDGDVGC